VALSEDDITRAVARAREAVGSDSTWSEAPAVRIRSTAGSRATANQPGVFPTLEQAVRAARTSFDEFRQFPLQRREKMIARIRQRLQEHVDELAELAHRETGLGRIEDKRVKNRLVIDKTPGPEILRPESQSGDDGLMLTEWAPYGIIGAITPVTNPSETIINNGISMLAAGNTVVFNPHPSAKMVSARTVALMNTAAMEEGAPANLLCTPVEPSIDTAQALMNHAAIRLLVVTGGPAVVRAALDSGKKCITAGPGNPPSVVDDTACISRAARSITAGASLDNGIICTAEKLVITLPSVLDELVAALRDEGNHILSAPEFEVVEKIIFEELRGPRRRGHIQRELIGKNAQQILARAGIRVDEKCRLAIALVDNDHPLLWTEQMMPVLPVTTAPDPDTAMALAVEMEGGNRHTFTMHSRRVDRLSKMARMCDASIFVKNGPNFAGLGAGGEGPTSFTIATPTGEGLTDARSFSRRRRCTLVDDFRIV
jgi:propionaldehyde dehydrogenase